METVSALTFQAQLLEGKASKAPTHPSLPPRHSAIGVWDAVVELEKRGRGYDKS